MADSTSAGTATYVYAVMRDLSTPRLGDIEGIDDQPVRIVDHAGLAALVSTVALDEFGEEALHRNLEDLGWLETTARAHHRVVEAAGSVAATAPLRLATVYHGDDRVRALLSEQQEAFTTALARVEGKTEWGVKVYADPEIFAEDPAPEPSASSASGPGAAYLQRRRSQRRSREDAGRAATARAEEIHAALSEQAAATRRHPPQDQRLTGHAGWMILNGAYLVDDEAAAEFRGRVAEFGEERGIDVDLTGPWVPYSFASPDQES